MKKLICCFFLLFIFIAQSHAQDKNTTIEDGLYCSTELKNLQCLIADSNYIQAQQLFNKLLDSCPYVNKLLYIQGEIIYCHFINHEEDKSNKNLLVDTLMMIYDQRISHFGNEGFVLGKKGRQLHRYRKDSLCKAYNTFEKSISIQNFKSEPGVLASFLGVICNLYDQNNISKEEAIHAFDRVETIINYNLLKNPDNKRFIQAQAVFENLSTHIPDCEHFILQLIEMYNQSDNIYYKMKMLTLLRIRNCQENKSYNILHKEHQLLEIEHYLFQNHKRDKKTIRKDKKYLLKSIENLEDSILISKYYLGLAKIEGENKNRELARKYSNESIKINPSWGMPFLFLGKLYTECIENCKDIFNSKSVYWLAVDYCKKAKRLDSDLSEQADILISYYSKQFPVWSYEFNQYPEGSSYFIDCWIKESTIIRYKKTSEK